PDPAGFQSTIKNQQSTVRHGVTILLAVSPREVSMPLYDYVCLDCHKSFETTLTQNEHDKEVPKCPHCGSKNVEQEAAAFFAVTSRKS
ncbi:MAG: zinc ribbon domain-containing protein, partial [Candidatus Sulfotelmatobacter sp.]